MTAKLTIELFGGLRVRNDAGNVIEFPPQQTGLLLASLALAMPRKLTREEVICLLWPDDNIDEARQRLRQCLYTLRRQLESLPLDAKGILVASRSYIFLNPAQVQTDTETFETALQAAKQTQDAMERIAW